MSKRDSIPNLFSDLSVVCRTCGVVGLREDFSPSRNRKICKPCQNLWLRKYRQANLAKTRANANRWAKKNLAKTREYQKRCQSKPWPRAGALVRGAKNRAKTKGIPFSLTRKWVFEKFASGCEMTGIPFDLETKGRVWINPWGPSLDRIDPDGPYSPENTRVVCWAYNLAKCRWTDADVVKMAEALVQKTLEMRAQAAARLKR